MYSLHAILASDTPVPYDYQYELYSAIQAQLKNYDENLSLLVHTNRGRSLFNLSSLLPIGFSGKRIWENARRFTFIVNTVDGRVKEAFSSFMREGKSLILNSVALKVVSVATREKDFARVPILPELHCRGPVVIRESGKYFRVGDPEFESKLSSALKRKADAITGNNTTVRGLTITSAHRKMYNVHGHNVPASIITFILDSDEDVIKTALIYGVGQKTQMGFGMVSYRD